MKIWLAVAATAVLGIAGAAVAVALTRGDDGPPHRACTVGSVYGCGSFTTRYLGGSAYDGR